MIRLELPGIPPSVNNAYTNNPKRRLPNGQMVGGGRKLTTEGKNYLTTTKATLAQKFRKELVFLKPNIPYLVVVRMFFETIENAGYPKKTDTRYKTFDITNRIKLLEDALKDAGGFDDSQTLMFLTHKVQGLPERTVIWLWNVEEEETPFDGPLLSLFSV